MKKIKRLLITLIIFLVVLCTSIFNNNYVQTTKKNNIISEYLALDSTTTLKNITIKKEIIDAKEYYVAGDDIKYKFTITNNNAESVKVNILDNYNNIGNNQRNLVLESAKCNDAEVSVSGNKIELTDIELSSNGTHICTVDAYAKNTYPEGKVNSRVKVFIDDEEEYKESHFTYLVRDSILDIQVNKFSKYSYYYEEDIVYQLKIKNLSTEDASGKIVFKMSPWSDIRLDDPYTDNYKYTLSGALSQLIDNSKIKLKCVANDGGICVTDQAQHLTFTIPGLNPGETMTLDITLNNTVRSNYALNIYNTIYEYEKEGNKVIKESDYQTELLIVSQGDTSISMYPIDKNGNRITELSDLEFVNGKTEVYLNYDFYRLKDYGYTRHTGAPWATLTLPSNVEYDDTRNVSYTGCGSSTSNVTGAEVTPTLLSNSLYQIRTACGMGNSASALIYNANVKVPITINNRLTNREICLNARFNANQYCFGPEVRYLTSSAKQSGNIVDIELQFSNYGEIGSAKDAKITYTYDSGLEIDEGTLTNATIDKKNKTITWIVPLIRKNELHTIEFKAKNTSGLTELNIAGKAEENSYEKTISIVQEGKNYLKGDWNLDETVNLLDLSYCRNYLAENGNLALPPAEVYDFDEDKKPTLLDLTGLRKLLVS